MPKLKSQHFCIWGLFIFILAACTSPWQKVPDCLQANNWSVRPPKGWMHMATQDSEMFSKDGPYLEYIFVQSRPLNQGFRFTSKKMKADMLPHEAAQLIVDNMQSDPQIHQFKLLSSEPTFVSNHTGFKLAYTYQDQHGVLIQSVYYGVVLPHVFFNLRYAATQRHYYHQELPAFEKLLRTLRISS